MVPSIDVLLVLPPMFGSAPPVALVAVELERVPPEVTPASSTRLIVAENDEQPTVKSSDVAQVLDVIVPRVTMKSSAWFGGSKYQFGTQRSLERQADAECLGCASVSGTLLGRLRKKTSPARILQSQASVEDEDRPGSPNLRGGGHIGALVPAAGLTVGRQTHSART